MIITTLADCFHYEAMIPNITNILDEISKIKGLVPGRYESNYGFYMIQKGKTVHSDEGLFETHDKYIDLQIMLEGEEILHWAKREDLLVNTEYNEERDLTLYTGKGSEIKITKNMCYFMFPEDGHKACTHNTRETDYLKLVYKIKI